MAGCYNLADLCRPPAAQRIVNIPFSGASPAFMTKQSKPKYRRILLKLSGEALGGESGVGICPEAIHDMACQIGEVRLLGVVVVIEIGGGYILRGLNSRV